MSNKLRPLVYIAGPITKGDKEENVRRAVLAFKVLNALGIAAICPHLSYYAERDHDCAWDLDTWLAIDLPQVKACKAVLRIPGDSTGSDCETAFCDENTIPVWRSIFGVAAYCLCDDLEDEVCGFLEAVESSGDIFSPVQFALNCQSILKFLEERKQQPAPRACDGELTCTLYGHEVSRGTARPAAACPGPLKDSGTRADFGTGAVRDVQEGKGRFDLIFHFPYALQGLAQVFEAGNAKYPNPKNDGRLNCEFGIPTHVCANSALRHLAKYIAGYRDEPHLFQAIWNTIVLAETEARIAEGRLPKELSTLPEPIPGELLPTAGWQANKVVEGY
jgi:hypothetical protein